jgi:hypothetical protein
VVVPTLAFNAVLTPTSTPEPTSTPSSTPTPLPTATFTPLPTATETLVPTLTATATDTAVPTVAATTAPSQTPPPVQPTAVRGGLGLGTEQGLGLLLLGIAGGLSIGLVVLVRGRRG